MASAQNLPTTFKHGPGVDLQLTRSEFTLEMASRHYFETANNLNGAYQFTFQLQLARKNMRVNLGIRPYYQEITRFHFAAETAVNFYRQIVAELAGNSGVPEQHGSQ